MIYTLLHHPHYSTFTPCRNRYRPKFPGTAPIGYQIWRWLLSCAQPPFSTIPCWTLLLLVTLATVDSNAQNDALYDTWHQNRHLPLRRGSTATHTTPRIAPQEAFEASRPMLPTLTYDAIRSFSAGNSALSDNMTMQVCV